MFLIVFTSYFSTAFNSDGSGIFEPWVFGNAFSLTWLVTYEDKRAFVFTSIYVTYYGMRILVSSSLINYAVLLPKRKG
jgi:hypothetical protein